VDCFLIRRIVHRVCRPFWARKSDLSVRARALVPDVGSNIQAAGASRSVDIFGRRMSSSLCVHLGTSKIAEKHCFLKTTTLARNGLRPGPLGDRGADQRAVATVLSQ